MRNRLFAAVIAVVVLGAALGAAVASAATINGKLHGASWDASTKTGRVSVVKHHTKTIYRINSATNCGVSFGQSGDQIPCKSLGKSKYKNKPVTVQWKKDSKGHRVASLVAVHLEG